MVMQKTVTICNKLGLHARASTKLVDCADKFSSEIMLHCNGKKVNAKSIMGIMMLAASKGTEIEIVIDGEDESEAMYKITHLIENRFGEDE